jgi:hypothetical protein
MKEYRLTGWQFDASNDRVTLIARRSESGPEIQIQAPMTMLASLGMHARRALQGHRNHSEPVHGDWKAAHALPVQTARILNSDDQTVGRCLLVLDPGTDVELLLSLQTDELVRGLAEALQEAADQPAQKPPTRN